MNVEHEKRLVQAVEVIAISLAHVCAGWINIHFNPMRANYLLDHIEPKVEWRMQRYGR